MQRAKEGKEKERIRVFNPKLVHVFTLKNVRDVMQKINSVTQIKNRFQKLVDREVKEGHYSFKSNCS